MADPTRYFIHANLVYDELDVVDAEIVPSKSPAGDWIKWADFVDYKAAQRRNASLETNTQLGVEIAEVRSKMADLTAENERLRKAIEGGGK